MDFVIDPIAPFHSNRREWAIGIFRIGADSAFVEI
jgi:hypothetical protein